MNPRYIIMSRVILLIGLGLGNKEAPGRGAFLLFIPCDFKLLGFVLGYYLVTKGNHYYEQNQLSDNTGVGDLFIAGMLTK